MPRQAPGRRNFFSGANWIIADPERTCGRNGAELPAAPRFFHCLMSHLFAIASACFASPTACVLGVCATGKRVGGSSVMVKKSKKPTPTRPSH